MNKSKSVSMRQRDMLENKDPPSQNPKRPSLLVPHSYLNTGAIPKRKSIFLMSKNQKLNKLWKGSMKVSQ